MIGKPARPWNLAREWQTVEPVKEVGERQNVPRTCRTRRTDTAEGAVVSEAASPNLGTSEPASGRSLLYDPPLMTTSTPAPDTSRQYLPVLILLFVGSGCAALIYEVVWLQLLQLVIGSSAVSLGVLLGTFMGGMCLGSFLLPRYIDPKHHPLKVYAYLELGIGAMGLLLLWGMPLIGSAYTSWAGGSVIIRSIVAAICLLPPTLMMGATLPAVARWVQTTPAGVSWLGFFYGGNIGGAVVGSLLAGFYLLRIHDMAFATYTAVVLNVIVAALGLTIARVTTHAAGRRRQRGRRARAGCDRGVHDDRALGVHGALGGGPVDAPAVAPLRRDRLHVFVDPGRLPVRTWHRQHHRCVDCAKHS